VSIGLILLNGAFVAMEFSLLASLRTRLEPLAEEGHASARRALAAMSRLGPMLAGTQLGVTIASLALGSIAEPTAERLLDRLLRVMHLPHGVITVLGVIVSLGIVVFLHLLFGEMVPKSIALSAPERTLTTLVTPVTGFVAVFRPVIWFLNTLARLGARAFGAEPADQLRTSRSAAELSMMLEESTEEGLLGDDELELLTGALELVDRSVAEVMIPRTAIVSVSQRCTVDEAESAVRESGHSRLLVVDEDLDHVLGFIHVKDLLALDHSARSEPLALELRRNLVVEPTTTLGDVLVTMQARRIHLAVVGAGETLGMITLEDVLESIVGDIVDETDHETGPGSGSAQDGT
jgi:CBS domain containing-hemolysin-like protein